MTTPADYSPQFGANLTANSFDIGRGIGSGSLSDASSLQYPPTPPDDSPYNHQQNSYSKARANGSKKHCLDLSGPFPYFDEKLTFIRSERELTTLQINELEKQTLSQHGYIRTKYVATTLQGEVFNGKLISNLPQTVVIKKTSKKLHKLGITVTKSGKVIKVKENIVAEAQLLEKFTNNTPPTSLIEYYDFFEDSHYYYLVMEHGGTDFFDFVVECQDRIVNDKLSLSEWRKHCKFMFAQMVQFLRWMHGMNCCYLDMSLENMLIKESARFDAETGKLSGCYIKFIDFGLSEFFDGDKNPNFLCQKYVGKTHYKSPKVYGKKEVFCADKADVWSLGVCLFMMVIGAPPYNKPVDQDVTYQFIKYKQISKLLQEWGRIKYVTSNLHDLLTKMLTYDESQRITLDEIVRHPWIKHYFEEQQQKQQPVHVPAPIKTTFDDVPQTDDEFPPNSPEIVNRASVSMSLSQQPYAHAHNQKVNAMVPQQCISYSVSRKSVSHSQSSHLYTNRHRYSSPYSPYTPYSPHPNTNNPGTGSPTPIMQSRTSKHDHPFYFAALDKHEQKTKKSKTKHKKQKKANRAKKSFFKLFGGH